MCLTYSPCPWRLNRYLIVVLVGALSTPKDERTAGSALLKVQGLSLALVGPLRGAIRLACFNHQQMEP